MTDIPVKDSDAQPPQAVAAPRDARTRPACAGTALETFERQVLVFPLLVVVLACSSFLFGGTCAAWQWWTAVAAVVAIPFVRKNRRRAALGAAGLFALLLFALRCLIPPLVWDTPDYPDMLTCHVPSIQLLVEGWNPVADPLADGITASLGLDLWGMAPLHVAFSMKALAVFSAVAHFFVRDPFALTFPLPVFLWLGVFLSGIRIFRGFARWTLVAALVFVLPAVACRLPVDRALSFASCGLLLAMVDALRRNRRKECDWLALGIWGAWMASLKLNGLFGLAVFAAAFAVAEIRKERGARKAFALRFAAWWGAVLLATAVVSWNPLGTSWRTYGHPLYPYRTVNADRFPVMDLAWDLKVGNDDFRKMGKAGLLAHAYVGPGPVRTFYRWRLHDDGFDPVSPWWKWEEFPTVRFRAELWLTFLVLFLLPAGRIWGMAGLILLCAVPDSMAGFTRYQPWIQAFGCLAAALAAEWFESRSGPRPAKVLSMCVATLLCLFFTAKAPNLADKLECKSAETGTCRKRIRTKTWVAPAVFYRTVFETPGFAPRYDYSTCRMNAAKLLLKERGLANETAVLPEITPKVLYGVAVEWNERKWLPGGRTATAPSDERAESAPPISAESSDEPEEWILSPFGYWIPVDEKAKHVQAYFGQTGPGSTTSRMGTFLHAWFVTYPREVLRRLKRKTRDCPDCPHLLESAT